MNGSNNNNNNNESDISESNLNESYLNDIIESNDIEMDPIDPRNSLNDASVQFNRVDDSAAVDSYPINHDEVHVIDPHPIDCYVDLFYDDINEIDTEFYQITQKDIDNNFIIPTPKRTKRSRLAPIVLMNIKAINGVRLPRPLVGLCDSGSTGTLVKDSSLPYGCIPTITEHKQISTSTHGTYECDRVAYMEHIQLPEFVNGRSIQGVTANVFHSPTCPYDVILGVDFLQAIGMKFDFNNDVIQWLDIIVDMKNVREFKNFLNIEEIGLQPEDAVYLSYLRQLNESYNDIDDDDFLCDDAWDCFATEILERKYERVTAKDVAAEQDHMSDRQKIIFENTLKKYEVLFDGKLGHYPHRKFHIDLVDNAKPVFKKAYHVPFQRESLFKNELQNLVNDGVLEPCGPSAWAAPTFVVPKKDNRVRWVSDFRELNKLIKRKPFPMPRIQDIMNSRGKYKHFTKIDLSMFFFCFELDEESKELCTINTPYGLFRYKRLAMGVKVSPDVAQSMITEIMAGLDCVSYIDDCGIWTDTTFEQHMELVGKVLSRLVDAGMKCNPLKCDWAVEETDFLGYWMTPTAIKPMKKKVEAVLKMQRPKNKTEARSFIGAVNYYKSLWPRRAHLLAPLSELTGNKPFSWDDRKQRAFDAMKALMASNCINKYPDYTKTFHIYTDASDYQLGAAIIQDGEPIAYYSKKLTETQRNYTTTEKELLAIVYCLKEYRKILQGGVIKVYTDHKNLTFNTLSVQRVLRWRIFMDEFDLSLHYIEGKKNVLADCFSRLPIFERSVPLEDNNNTRKRKRVGTPIDFHTIKVPKDDTMIDDERFFNLNEVYVRDERINNCDSYFNIDDDNEIMDLFLNLPPMTEMHNPINMQDIHNHQQQDAELLQQHNNNPILYPMKVINGVNIITMCNEPAQPTLWKIYLPVTMIANVIHWYHVTLGHVGIQKLYDTIRDRFSSPRLYTLCMNYRCPDNCHQYKQQGVGYGHLPARNAQVAPWDEVAVDLIGPWKIEVQGREFTFNALTCIDPVSNLVEIVRINNKSSAHIADQFANVWLSRYPSPNRCIHDNGGEFIGHEFRALLDQNAIKAVPTTVKNPQSNAMCERMHQTVANVLRILMRTKNLTPQQQAEQIMDNALATVMHATRCSVNHQMRTSPGALTFRRDMFVDVPIMSDLIAIRNQRQQLIDTNLMRHNRKRYDHHYQINDLIMVLVYDPDKMQEKLHGPYPILEIRTNGTVRIQRAPNVLETFNIRKIVPYKG